MIKINKHIEIVSSDYSWLSSMSARSRDAAFSVLAKNYAKVGISIVNNLSELEDLIDLKPDLVFLGMEFVPVDLALRLQDTDKIWISKYLEEHGIAYTGSDQMAHELERNKPLAKQRVLDAGLKTLPYYIARQNQEQTWNDLRLKFPLFVKPTNRGGGLGIDSDSKVHNVVELESKVRSIASRLESDSLIEEYLDGREFSVAILKNMYTDEFLVMPIELITKPDSHGERVLGSKVKSSNTELALKITDNILKSKVTTLAIDAFQALGARDYGRIDIRLDDTGTPYFLEANLIPSLISGYGSFPKACALNINMNYESMILNIVELGLARNLTDAENALKPYIIPISVLPDFETTLNVV